MHQIFTATLYTPSPTIIPEPLILTLHKRIFIHSITHNPVSVTTDSTWDVLLGSFHSHVGISNTAKASLQFQVQPMQMSERLKFKVGLTKINNKNIKQIRVSFSAY